MARARAGGSVRMKAMVCGAVAIMAFGLSGCATAAAEGPGSTPMPTPSASAPSLVAEPVSGTGPTGFPGVDFTIPAGAQSVVVDFECDGGGVFTVELGDSMMLGQAAPSGTCGVAAGLAWPITEQTGATLSVMVAEGVQWSATPAFSTEAFTFDDALTRECEEFASAYSALMNADVGYGMGEVDAAEWTARVDEAAEQLEVLVDSAESELVTAFSQVHGIAVDPARTMGAVVMGGGASPFDEINTACNTNQTPLVLKGEFGG